MNRKKKILAANWKLDHFFWSHWENWFSMVAALFKQTLLFPSLLPPLEFVFNSQVVVPHVSHVSLWDQHVRPPKNSDMCCSVLQCVAMCCSVLQCVAVRCSVLQCVAVRCSVLQCVAVRCSVLQFVAVCCSVLQCVAVCCSVLQCVAVCCSVLQCVAVLDGRNALVDGA